MTRTFTLLSRAPHFAALACLLTTSCGDYSSSSDASGSSSDGSGSSNGSDGNGSGSDGSSSVPVDPGNPVEVGVNAEALTLINSEIEEVQDWNSDELMTEYPVAFDSALTFDPTTALAYDLIQASDLALSPSEEAAFAEHGFVISPQQAFATFSYGYHSVYVQNLPVYVTADSVLDALHRSYDDILKDLELELLIPTLETYLSGMRARLAVAQASEVAKRDTDFFLAMAESLLRGEVVAPSFDTSFDPAELSSFYDAATTAEGIRIREIFGFERRMDFSQFKPRGHYTDSEELSRYFRAMMWLGRIDLRMIETQEDGTQVLRRSQVEMTLLLRGLMDESLFEQWSLVDRTVSAFVGEHDYMHAGEVDALQADLEIDDVAGLGAISDDELAQTIIDGSYGEQRIASHVIRKADVFGPTLPLNVSFALFGQRYVVDSHVFSQVVFDRVKTRVMPHPLDAAFAALGNNHALTLLTDEMAEHEYASNLAAMRRLVDAHPAQSWQSSLYTSWLSALRTLSASEQPAGGAEATASETSTDLPAVARSEPWARRLLNTQLASWAQLRHDTLLYAKQSYTGFGDCEFPDAYVDPYPAFWAQLLQFADSGAALLDSLDLPDSEVARNASDYFARFAEIVGVLHAMSEEQLTGLPHSAEHLEFINQAVLIYSGGSGPPTIEGWYHRLLYNPSSFSDVDLTIADVHTDPGGALPIPRDPSVLHVGTSYPRLMVVAIETCDGPRAYAGPVYTYKEHRTDGLIRLDDEAWTELVDRQPARDQIPDETWMTPLFGD